MNISRIHQNQKKMANRCPYTSKQSVEYLELQLGRLVDTIAMSQNSSTERIQDFLEVLDEVRAMDTLAVQS